jgi:hypothetical protein
LHTGQPVVDHEYAQPSLTLRRFIRAREDQPVIRDPSMVESLLDLGHQVHRIDACIWAADCAEADSPCEPVGPGVA